MKLLIIVIFSLIIFHFISTELAKTYYAKPSSYRCFNKEKLLNLMKCRKTNFSKSDNCELLKFTAKDGYHKPCYLVKPDKKIFIRKYDYSNPDIVQVELRGKSLYWWMDKSRLSTN